MEKLKKTFRWFGPEFGVSLKDIKQIGVEGIVAACQEVPLGEVWSMTTIKSLKDEIEAAGLDWSVVESVNVHTSIKYGLDDRDVYIENYIQTLKNLAANDIYTVCYNFMQLIDWTRTDLDYKLENGASALRFDPIAATAFDLFILKRTAAENDYDVAVVKRITIGNKVIDHEKVTGNGKIQMQVAIYEINNGAISSMTFIFDDTNAQNPETIVQLQLNAYNDRAIDKFLLTYTEDIKVYDFPSTIRSQGQQQMREGFTSFFEATPDLHCEIKNRIVIGNKVIDEEYITANGTSFNAIAIYEVEKGKIAKVTFVK